MIIVSSLDLSETSENDLIKFSVAYSDYMQNYTDYIENVNIRHRFEPTDFYIRNHKPNYLDIAICIYLLGYFINSLIDIQTHLLI